MPSTIEITGGHGLLVGIVTLRRRRTTATTILNTSSFIAAVGDSEKRVDREQAADPGTGCRRTNPNGMAATEQN